MKINFEKVGFRNFLSFGDRYQEVPLKKGLNLVMGWDKDRNKSNGAGKSSFLESIPFALFGNVARNVTKKQIVNWKNQKNCEVNFCFGIGDNKYEVFRALKPDKFEIYKNGTMIDQTADKRDYQKEFDEMFGMDLKMFMNIVHSNLNDSAKILSLSKAEKRKFMEKMFGLEIYSAMNEMCNEKLRNIKSKFTSVEMTLSTEVEKVENAEKMIKQFQDEIESKKIDEDEIKEKESELKKMKKDSGDLKGSLKAVKRLKEKEIQKLHDDISETEVKKAEATMQIKQIDQQLLEIEKQEKDIENNKKIESKCKTILDKLKVGSAVAINELITEAQRKVDELENSYSKLRDEWDKEKEKRRKEFDKKKSKVTKNLIETEADLKNLQKNMEMLKEGTCPVCGQDVSNPKAHYKKEIEEKSNKVEQLKVKKEDIERTEVEFMDDLNTDYSEKLEKIEEDIGKRKNKIKILDKTKQTVYDLQSKIKNVSAKTEDVDKLKEERDGFQGSLNGYENIIKEFKKQKNEKSKEYDDKIEEIENQIETIRRKENELENLKNKAQSAKEQIDYLNKMIKEQKEIIKKSKNRQKEEQDRNVKLNNISDYLSAIKLILKDEEIKQYAISQIMPYLNKQANYYLSEVDYSFYILLDKWLDVQIKGPGIRNATYGSLSGGERRGIDMSIQLGFLDIARTQSGVFPDFLTFDELLDSSIDGRGIGELLKLVKVKQRELDGKLFIISHREELDSELIDNVYNVIKENEFSRVEF